jgi:hypothetical protein
MLHDKKKVAAIIIARKNGDGSESQGSAAPEAATDDDMDAKMEIAKDLMAALESKSAHGVAAALGAMFDLCESEPHVEGENETEEQE